MAEELNLRVGGVYLNRMNKCIKIVHDAGPDYEYRFVSSMGHGYTQKGRRWGSINPSSHHCDLVSEVIEAPPADDLRTQIATAAMTGILAGTGLGIARSRLPRPNQVADMAVDYADALIAALKEATND